MVTLASRYEFLNLARVEQVDGLRDEVDFAKAYIVMLDNRIPAHSEPARALCRDVDNRAAQSKVVTVAHRQKALSAFGQTIPEVKPAFDYVSIGQEFGLW